MSDWQRRQPIPRPYEGRGRGGVNKEQASSRQAAGKQQTSSKGAEYARSKQRVMLMAVVMNDV